MSIYAHYPNEIKSQSCRKFQVTSDLTTKNNLIKMQYSAARMIYALLNKHCRVTNNSCLF